MEEQSRRASVAVSAGGSGGGTAAVTSLGTVAGNEMTTIKVFCRLRLQNQLEKREGATQCSTVLDGRTMFLRNDKCDVDEIRCTFDRVFDIHSSQQEVYTHTAKPLVEDFLEGYNCTIFAYGQTGSGKTHTILGPKDGVLGKLEDEGIISRVVRDTFKSVMASAGTDVKIELTASFVEIYMEQIRDLLVPAGSAMPAGGLKIRENTQRGVYIEEMTQVPCTTANAMLDVVKTGTLNRAVSSTRMNKDSSRSHCILMIGATRKEQRGAVVKRSTMYIVDLAGSEFVNKTNASGKVLQEAKAINKSLSALSNVIKALGEGKKHVPYRDSKLTRLLQDSLGGSAKTCLILAASCSSYNMPETISTLRFGLRAKEIKNPVAMKHDGAIGPGGIFKELYQQAMEDIDEKNKKIDELQRLLALAYEASTGSGTQIDHGPNAVTVSPSKLASAHLAAAMDADPSTTPSNDVGEPTEDTTSDNASVSGQDARDSGDLGNDEAAEDSDDSEDSDARARIVDELEDSNRRLADENMRLFNILEALDSQLDHITVRLSQSGRPYLGLGAVERDEALTLKVWLQSESWRQLTDADQEESFVRLDASRSEVDSDEEASSPTVSPLRSVEEQGASVPGVTTPTTEGTAPTTASPVCLGGVDGTACVHRVDSEALSRQIVELKLQLHYLTESTKQSLDGEQYIIVLENAKLKTRIEELEFQANLGNVRCNQLEMKNRACETRLSNQETHISCLQNSLQEYQGLFKQQIIMSQEKCRLLSDELEFYKKLSKYGQELSSPSPTRSSSLRPTSSPPKGPSISSTSNLPPGSPLSILQDANGSNSPFSRWKSLSTFYKLGRDPDAVVTPLTAKAQRMIVKPVAMPLGTATTPEASAPSQPTVAAVSPWRRKGFDLSFSGASPIDAAMAMALRSASSPDLRTRLLAEDALTAAHVSST